MQRKKPGLACKFSESRFIYEVYIWIKRTVIAAQPVDPANWQTVVSVVCKTVRSGYATSIGAQSKVTTLYLLCPAAFIPTQ